MWHITPARAVRCGRCVPVLVSQSATRRMREPRRTKRVKRYGDTKRSNEEANDSATRISPCRQWCACYAPLFTPWWSSEVPANAAAVPLSWTRYRFSYMPSRRQPVGATRTRTSGSSVASGGVGHSERADARSESPRRMLRFSSQPHPAGRRRETAWERAWSDAQARQGGRPCRRVEDHDKDVNAFEDTMSMRRMKAGCRKERKFSTARTFPHLQRRWRGRRTTGTVPFLPPPGDAPPPPPPPLQSSSLHGTSGGSAAARHSQRVYYYCHYCYGVSRITPSYDRKTLPFDSSPYGPAGLSLREKASTAASAVWDSIFGGGTGSGPATTVAGTEVRHGRSTSHTEPSSRNCPGSKQNEKSCDHKKSGASTTTKNQYGKSLTNTQERLSVFLQKLSPMLRLVGLKGKSKSGTPPPPVSLTEKRTPLVQPPSTRHQIKAVLSFGKELTAQVHRSKITSASPLFMLSSMVKLTLGSASGSQTSSGSRAAGGHVAPRTVHKKDSMGPSHSGKRELTRTSSRVDDSTNKKTEKQEVSVGENGGRSRPSPYAPSPASSPIQRVEQSTASAGNENVENHDSQTSSGSTCIRLTVEQRYELFSVAVDAVRYAVAVYGVAYEQGMLHSLRKSILLFTHPLYQPLNYVSSREQSRAVERLVQATSGGVAPSSGGRESTLESRKNGVQVVASHYGTGDLEAPCSSYIIVVDHEKKQVIVAFRGTATLSDAVGCVRDGYASVELRLNAEDNDRYCSQVGGSPSVRNSSDNKVTEKDADLSELASGGSPTRSCSTVQHCGGDTVITRIPLGFYDMALSCADDILSHLQRLSSAHQGYNLILTGHSLGATIATIFHLLCCLPSPSRLLHIEESLTGKETTRKVSPASTVLPHWLDGCSCCDTQRNNDNAHVSTGSGFLSIQSLSFAPAPTVERDAAMRLSQWLQRERSRRVTLTQAASFTSNRGPMHQMAAFCYAQDLVPRLQSYAVRRFLLQHHHEEEEEEVRKTAGASSHSKNPSRPPSRSEDKGKGGKGTAAAVAESNPSFFSSLISTTLTPLRRTAARSLAGPPPSGASHLYIPGEVFFLSQDGVCGGVQPAELEDESRSDMNRVTHPTPMSSTLDVLRHHLPACYLSRIHAEFLFYSQRMQKRKAKGAVSTAERPGGKAGTI